MNLDQKNRIVEMLRKEGISHVVHSLARNPLSPYDRYEISVRMDLPERLMIKITVLDCIIQQTHTTGGHYLKIF